jgi:hypothetical protein
MYFETTSAHAFDFTSEQILVVDSQGGILLVIKFPGFFPFHHIFSTYHLVIFHSQFAMERSTIFKLRGKPSISMGHRKTMVMLFITRGYIFFFFASKAMNLSTDQDWWARISHVVPECQEVAARRNGSCESIVSLRRCRAQIWKAVQ